jgi:hypothetical protein
MPLNGSGPKPYPAFGDIEWRENKGTSTYNGLDLTIEKRFDHGYTARSGRPFTVVQGTNNVGSFATGLPNRIGDGTLSNPTVDRWFDPSAFQLVPSGTFGNSGRNILRGPGWVTVDMSLQRRVRLANRAEVTARWDVFNLFDRANFSLPNRDLSNSRTVGTITALAGDARTMLFSLRLAF